MASWMLDVWVFQNELSQHKLSQLNCEYIVSTLMLIIYCKLRVFVYEYGDRNHRIGDYSIQLRIYSRGNLELGICI